MSTSQTLIKQLTDHLMKVDRDLVEQDSVIAELEYEVESRQFKIETLERDLSERNSVIEDLEDDIKTLKAKNQSMRLVLPNGKIIDVEEIGNGYFKEIPHGLCIKILANQPPVVVGGYGDDGFFRAITFNQHQAMNRLGLTSDPLQKPPPTASLDLKAAKVLVVNDPLKPSEIPVVTPPGSLTTYPVAPTKPGDKRRYLSVYTTSLDKSIPKGYGRTKKHNLCIRLSDEKVVGSFNEKGLVDDLSTKQISFCAKYGLTIGAVYIPPSDSLDMATVKSLTGNDPIKVDTATVLPNQQPPTVVPCLPRPNMSTSTPVVVPCLPRPNICTSTAPKSDIQPVIDWMVKNQRSLEVDTTGMRAGYCYTLLYGLVIRMSDMTVVGSFAGPTFARSLSELQIHCCRELGLTYDLTCPIPEQISQ